MMVMQLEQWLRAALASKASEIEPSADLWERIQEKILAKKKARVTMLGSYWFPWEPLWKRVLAGAVAGALLVGSMTLGFSPQARAWAKDTVISPVISVVYTVVRTGDGYSVIKLFEGDLTKAGSTAKFRKGQADPTKVDQSFESREVKKGVIAREFSSTIEAETYLGFPVHLPAFLPEGYTLISISGDRWEQTGKGFANITYRRDSESQTGLTLLITNDWNFLREGNEVKKVKIGEKVAYWSEFPIMEINGESNEPTVRTGHMLKWKDEGLVYALQDTGQLGLEEMLRIAASIE
jgi:hypothetical protein